MSRVDASRLEGAAPSPTPVAAVAPSLEALYRDYFQFVWRTARRLGVEAAQIDDVVQDVFVVVHRQLAHYEARTTPRAWLFSIARRVAADHRRARRRKGDLVPIHDQLAAADDGPLRAALNKEKSDVILEFLSTLDDDLRAAFILCELEQLTAPEIAQAVDASTSAVYSRIRTARLAFAAYVRDRHPELMGDSHG